MGDDGNLYDLLEKSGLQVRRLLKEFSSLKELKLTYYLAQGLAQTKPGLPLSKFGELEKLYLSFRSVMRNQGQFELLRSAPPLKSLGIDMLHDKMESIEINYYDYNVMEPVPSCVVSHLVELELRHFKCATHQLRLAMFFLKNGAQLQKLSVICYVDQEKVEQQLSKFPKASARLTVVII